MTKLFDKTLWKFLLVGVGNTLFSAAIMYLLYDLAHFGYWGSSAVSYLLGSVLSFALNRKFTFQSRESFWASAWKFAVTVGACYLIAYSLAKPVVTAALSGTALTADWVERISMLFGMGLFTALNYFGQRFFAFKEK